MLEQTRTGCTPVNRGAGYEEPDAQERRKGLIDQGPGVLRGSRDWRSGLSRLWRERIRRVLLQLLQKC